MATSRDPFPFAARGARRLSDFRAHLKTEIEAIRIFGQTVFEVWINEEAAEGGGQQAWDHCLEQARDASERRLRVLEIFSCLLLSGRSAAR